jgi:hypothetical protein
MAKSYEDEVFEISNALKVCIKYLPKEEQVGTVNKILNNYKKEQISVFDFKMEQLIKDHRVGDNN